MAATKATMIRIEGLTLPTRAGLPIIITSSAKETTIMASSESGKTTTVQEALIEKVRAAHQCSTTVRSSEKVALLQETTSATRAPTLPFASITKMIDTTSEAEVKLITRAVVEQASTKIATIGATATSLKVVSTTRGAVQTKEVRGIQCLNEISHRPSMTAVVPVHALQLIQRGCGAAVGVVVLITKGEMDLPTIIEVATTNKTVMVAVVNARITFPKVAANKIVRQGNRNDRKAIVKDSALLKQAGSTLFLEVQLKNLSTGGQALRTLKTTTRELMTPAMQSLVTKKQDTQIIVLLNHVNHANMSNAIQISTNQKCAQVSKINTKINRISFKIHARLKLLPRKAIDLKAALLHLLLSTYLWSRKFL